ncbi:MAG: Lhr family ATP-dependent helicase, partial [Jiangellaceae bacterium]
LLLPRRSPGRRAPLWQQRQRSAQLLEVAAKFGSFPILLETVRECLHDVYDLPGLGRLMRDISARRIRVVEVETAQPSPFARSLLLGYVAAFMYEGDSPLAERRAQALALDSALLSELLGHTELRELLDLEVVEQTEAELQRLIPERQARDAEAVADLLRFLGPLTTDEVAQRCVRPERAAGWLAGLSGERRLIEVRIAGVPLWAAVEDAGRLRDGLGVPVPAGVHDAFAEPVADPLGDLIARHARTHAPFTAAAVARRFGLGVTVALGTLRRLAAEGRVVEGEFRPGSSGAEWCDAGVLRTLRRRSLAALRKEAEPVEPAALGRFLPAWQSVGGALSGPEGVLRVVEQLGGCAVPASAWEHLVLPARVAGYTPAWLDELMAAGEVVWAGHAALPGNDGWVSLHLADVAPLTLPDPLEAPRGEVHDAVLEAIRGGGAFFFRQIVAAVSSADRPLDDQTVLTALWELVWAGLVSNDTLAPLRALVAGSRPAHRTRA